MSEDKKEFYKKQLNADISNLSIANMVLKNLAARWDDKAEEILSIMESIREYQALLNVEGHMGYSPKVKIPDALFGDETAFDKALEIEKNVEAKELAKEVEAKRLAAEKAKAEKEALKAEKAAKKAELEAKLAELEE